MKLIDVFGISVTNFRGNPLRTFLTILGIGVGFATIVFLVSLGYGLQALSIQKVASIEAVDTLNVSSGKASLDQSFIDRYQQDEQIGKVIIVNTVPIQIETQAKDNKIDGVASLVDANFFSLEGLKPNAGDFYKETDTKSAVLSTGYLKGLNIIAADVIGQELSINFFIGGAGSAKSVTETVRVIGVYTDDSSAVAYITPDLLAVTGDLPIQQVKLKVKSRDNLITKRDEVESAGFAVSSVADTIKQLDTVFRVIQIVLGVFGAIALIVAAIGMFNTMTIALLERTRDIGVMKSLGAENSSVYYIFLSESLFISMLGGITGVILGWLTSKFVNAVINGLAQSVGGEATTLFVTPLGLVLTIIGFAFVVGVSTGFIPAKRASGLNPLDALRYE